MDTLRRSTALRLLLPLCLVGCAEPLAPVPQGPELSRFGFSQWMSPGPVLRFYATPADTSLDLDPDARFPVRLRSSSGEVANIALRPSTCSTPDGYLHACSGLLFRAGNVNVYRDVVRRLPAVMTLVALDSSLAGLTLVEGDAVDVMDEVLGWPGVVRASLDAVVCVRAPCRGDRSLRTAAELVAPGETLPHDHWISAEPGDQLIAEYRQPDGTIISDTLVVR